MCPSHCEIFTKIRVWVTDLLGVASCSSKQTDNRPLYHHRMIDGTNQTSFPIIIPQSKTKFKISPKVIMIKKHLPHCSLSKLAFELRRRWTAVFCQPSLTIMLLFTRGASFQLLAVTMGWFWCRMTALLCSGHWVLLCPSFSSSNNHAVLAWLVFLGGLSQSTSSLTLNVCRLFSDRFRTSTQPMGLLKTVNTLCVDSSLALVLGLLRNTAAVPCHVVRTSCCPWLWLYSEHEVIDFSLALALDCYASHWCISYPWLAVGFVCWRCHLFLASLFLMGQCICILLLACQFRTALLLFTYFLYRLFWLRWLKGGRFNACTSSVSCLLWLTFWWCSCISPATLLK